MISGNDAPCQSALRLGDDALVLAHQLGALLTRAPVLEEELALANISLDLLGQARLLLTYAASLSGGRDEDELAYLREPAEFCNVILVELADVDYAHTMVRQLAFSAWQAELYASLQASRDETLAAVAGKAVKEVRYHLEHAARWVVRLGDGTSESTRRAQDAVDIIWPHAAGLFVTDDIDRELAAAGVAPLPASLKPAWETITGAVLSDAGLLVPALGVGAPRGKHTERFTSMINEMQSVHRAHPGAVW